MTHAEDIRPSQNAVGRNNTPVTAGVIGAGLMGRWHAAAIRSAGGSLAAITDTNIDAARRLSKGYKGAQIFGDLNRMLAEATSLRVLHVCTPPETHYHIALQAIHAGLNVIIEKPLTPEAGETERLLSEAAQGGVYICPVHQFIFQEGVTKALILLPKIGRLVHINAIFSSAGGDLGTQQSLDEIAADILPHPISLLQRFLPGRVQDIKWEGSRPGAGELRFLGERAGITISIFVSMNSRPTQSTFELRGVAGSLHLDLFHGCAWMESGRVSRGRKILFPFEQAGNRTLSAASNLVRRIVRWEPAYPGLRRLIGSFYDSVRSGVNPPIAPDEIVQTALVRDLLLKKALHAGRYGTGTQEWRTEAR
jgi:predicted dehydrogenase